MTNDVPPDALEKSHLDKVDLHEFGPLIEDKKIDELWTLFCHILDSLNIEYVNYWYSSGGKASDIRVYEYGVENEVSIPDDEKVEFLSIWEETPYAFIERITEGYNSYICCWLPFFSNTPGYKAGTTLFVDDINEEEDGLWEIILIELSLLIEIINSRIIVKNSTFADNVDKLAPKQYRVLKEIGKSQDRARTADALGIAIDTYDNHLRAIKDKLRSKSTGRPSLERIRTNYSKYGTARKEYLTIMKKAMDSIE